MKVESRMIPTVDIKTNNNNMEKDVCPNCHKKLTGLLVTRSALNKEVTDFLNLFNTEKPQGYCTDCGLFLFNRCVTKLKEEKDEIIKSLSKIIDIIPIITSQNPAKWDYSVIEMVSAQSVTGTGIISEIASSWSDLLGGQSDALSSKLSAGENICKNQLRLSAAMLGGNCIIATDIDYAEVGGGKGMLMVCMAETAAILHNIDDVLEIKSEKLAILKKSVAELKRLNNIKIPTF